MTREQKMVVALQEARKILVQQISHSSIFRLIDEALATPPASEWNEAIEAAKEECRLLHDRIRFGESTSVEREDVIDDCIERINDLKRKEQP